MCIRDRSNVLATQANDLFVKSLVIDGKENVMLSKKNTNTKTGLTTMRYSQFYKGIKAEYGGASLLVKNGSVRLLTSNYYSFSSNPSTEPTIKERAAFALSLIHI